MGMNSVLGRIALAGGVLTPTILAQQTTVQAWVPYGDTTIQHEYFASLDVEVQTTAGNAVVVVVKNDQMRLLLLGTEVIPTLTLGPHTFRHDISYTATTTNTDSSREVLSGRQIFDCTLVGCPEATTGACSWEATFGSEVIHDSYTVPASGIVFNPLTLDTPLPQTLKDICANDDGDSETKPKPTRSTRSEAEPGNDRLAVRSDESVHGLNVPVVRFRQRRREVLVASGKFFNGPGHTHAEHTAEGAVARDAALTVSEDVDGAHVAGDAVSRGSKAAEEVRIVVVCDGAILAIGNNAVNEEYSITILSKSAGKAKPFVYKNNTYTTKPLHPTFHIPVTHWPEFGYSFINATVSITRPLASLATLLYEAAVSGNETEVDPVDLGPRGRAAALLAITTIPTETRSFVLFDDGSNGDTTANDHYWEVALPGKFTEFYCEYQLHAQFTFCQASSCGKQTCISDEAQQTITVLTLVDRNYEITVDKLPGQGNRAIRVVNFFPTDVGGVPLGPGYSDHLVVKGLGGVHVSSVEDLDGLGA
ncbi:uncharacterized protein DNG_02237 [Cephalotrichum gorgonifer]|uniref:IgGFc-binding protein N-terminal domain-containing protein n=1 Tax=Cephalotrichum gorgonifer TaxID=2041049 RepID=A0AAE8MU46_9PEZI|nr:uncharacterized protein DNG_02237 [Cephalotrichum gorgonifer]